MEKKEKRVRSSNFSKKEVDLLCTLVIKHSSVIECKITNAYTWQEKLQVWSNLCAEFNHNANGPPRTMICLKTKYETFKKELRKKVAANKRERIKTGGGVPEFTKLTPSEEKIHNLINLSVEGLQARYDDDMMYEYQNEINEEVDEYQIETDEPNQQTNLENNCVNNDILEDWNDDYENIIIECSDNTHEEIYENDKENDDHSLSEETREYKKDPVKTQDNLKKKLYADSRKADAQAVVRKKKWNPNQLQAPISNKLQVRRKNILTKLQASQKVNILSQAKKELIELQTQYLTKEMEFMENEHNLKLKKAEQELNNSMLDEEIKKLEKEIKKEMLKKLVNTTNLPF